MARLPTKDDLSRGAYRSAPMPTVADQTGAGRGLAGLGAAVADIGDDIVKQRGVSQIAGAEADYTGKVLELERNVDNSTDYGSYGKTFEAGAGSILESAAKRIADPAMRQRWIEEKKIDIARRQQGVLSAADGKQRVLDRVNLGSAIEAEQNIFTDLAKPEQERMAALGRIRANITAAEQTGLLDPALAEKWRKTYDDGSVLKEAELRVLNDQTFRQNVLRGDGVVDRIIGVESGGNPNAKNPKSSATGAGQFIDSTWMNMVRQYRPDLLEGRSAQEVLALRSDPALSREMTQNYANENAQFLKNQGIPVTDGNIYLAHFLGPRGAAQVLKADPGASVEGIVGAGVVNANPFLRGKSAGDVAAWAAKKMGGNPLREGIYASLSPEQRQNLYEVAQRKQREDAVQQRGEISNAVDNAPTAFANTGQYTGRMPTEDQFIAAYGPGEGAQRYAQFQSSVETARQMFDMRTMSAADIQKMVQDATPTSSGDDAVIEDKRYQTLSAAAAQTIKARETDPAAYVQSAFPAVAQAWEQAAADGDLAPAIRMSAAAQTQLGIRNMQLLPKDVAENAVNRFSDVNLPHQDRVSGLIDLLSSTSSKDQKRAIFNQLVSAGLPEMTQGAVEAYSRGDEAAGKRLMLAAMTDVSKLPGKLPEKSADISDTIQTTIMDEGQVGDIYYGLTDGTAENFERAQRDANLLKNAVSLRLMNGESLASATENAAKDLYGDVKPVMGNSRVNAQILTPKGADDDEILRRLEAKKADVRSALDALMAMPDVPEKDGQRQIAEAAKENKIRDVIENGIFRNLGDGYAFFDAFTGSPVVGPDGKPLVFRADDDGLPEMEEGAEITDERERALDAYLAGPEKPWDKR